MSHIYTTKGQRYLRKYTAAAASPVYAAAIDAQTIADTLCDVPWEKVAISSAGFTSHNDESLDENVSGRDGFDAALFCADHSGGKHTAHANAACYRLTLPDSAIGVTLESLSVKAASDPYNVAGLRIAILTNSTGTIPTDCATCRTGDAHVAGAVPRTTRTVGTTNYWDAAADTVVIEPTGGLTLQKYLLVFVVLENYATSRGNWLEGSGYIQNSIQLTTSTEISGWDGTGEIHDCSDLADDSAEFYVARDGVYQSNVGNVSGVFGVEVLKNGDSLDELAYTSEAVPGLSCVASEVADRVTNLKGLYTANVNFENCIYPLYNTNTNGSLTPGWTQHIIAFADAQFWGVKTYSSSEVVRVISFDGSATAYPIDVYTMKQEDMSAGIALAWIEGKLNSALRRVHVVTKNGVENTADVYENSGGFWWYCPNHSQRAHRYTNVPIPCCLCNGSPVYLGESSITGDGLPSAIPFVGTVTAVRCKSIPVVDAPNWNSVLVVSGNLQSVGGVAVRNCAVVTIEGGSMSVVRPSFDSAITPDTYDNFCVAPVQPILKDEVGNVDDDGMFSVGGSFSFLSGVSVAGFTLIDANGSFVEKTLNGPDGACSFVSNVLALYGGIYFYQASVLDILRVYPHGTITRALGVTDDESCIGMRALYAKLYGGLAKYVATAKIGDERFGVGFTVSSATKDVYSYDGSHVRQLSSVPVFRLSMASVAVPFSTPTDFVAKKIRLDWASWTGTVTGGRFNVWLARGKYVSELPGDVLTKPDIYIGNPKGVGEWEYLGSIDASDVETTSRLFELAKWLDVRLATIMLTAYVSMDRVNPSNAMVLPQGVATEFYADPNVGAVTGDAYLWKPDITLIG